MIVGLGIKLKSMSMRSWRWTSLRLPWNLCIVAIENPERHMRKASHCGSKEQ